MLVPGAVTVNVALELRATVAWEPVRDRRGQLTLVVRRHARRILVRCGPQARWGELLPGAEVHLRGRFLAWREPTDPGGYDARRR